MGGEWIEEDIFVDAVFIHGRVHEQWRDSNGSGHIFNY